ncbi:MAG: sugar phosphate isomerase/epimerase [Pseudohongiellaceae bacterium]|jgi:sugar phosphate isomerase/epimerase
MNNKSLSRTFSRRKILKTAAITGAGMSLPWPVLAQSRRVDKQGIQLYSLRQEMGADFEGTLAKLAEIGFKEMEFAGYFDKTPSQVRGILDAHGLTSPAAHIPLEAIRNNLNKVIDTAATIGQKYIVLPYMVGADREYDNYARIAELLNYAGEAGKNAGIKMGYHNHDFEFDKHDGRMGYDVLLEQTDDDLVFFEMDLYWAATAGIDARDYFRKYPGRFTMLHVKDQAADGEMADVGRGIIDFADIFSMADIAGFEHYFIEHDNPSNGINSITYSYNTVNQLRF